MCYIPGEGFTPSEMGSGLPEPHPYRPGEEQVSSWNIKKAFLESVARLRRTQVVESTPPHPQGPLQQTIFRQERQALSSQLPASQSTP